MSIFDFLINAVIFNAAPSIGGEPEPRRDSLKARKREVLLLAIMTALVFCAAATAAIAYGTLHLAPLTLALAAGVSVPLLAAAVTVLFVRAARRFVAGAPSQPREVQELAG